MSTTSDELLSLFIEGFDERLKRVEGILLSDECGSEASITTVKRELHTIKGNTAAVGFPSCSSLCHQLEDCIDGTDDPAEFVDQLLDGIQVLRGAVCSMAEGRDIDASAQEALSQIETAQETCHASAAAVMPGSPSPSNQPSEPEPPKTNYSILFAASVELAGSGANLVAEYGVQSRPLPALLDGDARTLSDALGPVNAFVVHLPANAETVTAAIRMIERYRFDETNRGIFGENRIPIVAIAEGDDENACRELRAAGAQYAFATSTDERIPKLLQRMFLSSLRRVDGRKSIRFRDIKDTYATFRDGSRRRATVRDESRTGIAIQLLDPSPCDVLMPVAVDVLGAAMPAYIVRVTGRDERGYVTVGLRWGRLEATAN